MLRSQVISKNTHNKIRRKFVRYFRLFLEELLFMANVQKAIEIPLFCIGVEDLTTSGIKHH